MTKAKTFNYDGISHNGEIRVAKGGVEQKLLHINKNTCLVKSYRKNKSYHVTIHKDLKDSMIFASKNDTAIVKFRRGEAYLIGFIKKGVDEKCLEKEETNL